jgi:mutator protein MutT
VNRRGERNGHRSLVVVAAVIERGGWVLVSQRRHDAGHAGRWEFPGGKREPGEGDAAALRRELREELGIEVRIGRVLWREEAGPLRLRFFACGYPAHQRPRAIESAQFRWVRRADLPRYEFPPADAGLVDALASGRLLGPRPR